MINRKKHPFSLVWNQMQLILVILIFLINCSAEQSSLPMRSIQSNFNPPEFTVTVIAVAGLIVVGATAVILIGLAKGTYELTDDLWNGFTVANREVVLGYNDYKYDATGKIQKVSSYLPYRAITRTPIPIYDLGGKKQISTIYPGPDPVLLFEIFYKYRQKASFPESVI